METNTKTRTGITGSRSVNYGTSTKIPFGMRDGDAEASYALGSLSHAMKRRMPKWDFIKPGCNEVQNRTLNLDVQ